MTYHPSKPWVMGVCLIGLLIGYFEHMVLPPGSRVTRLTDQFPQIDQFKILRIPNIEIRDFIDMISSPQIYIDAFMISIVILIEATMTINMMNLDTDQRHTDYDKNIMSMVYANLSSVFTGCVGATYPYDRSFLNWISGAKNQLSCILNGAVSIGVGYLFFKLFMYIPSIVMEAIVFTLNLRTTRFEEVAYTVRHDGKLITTNGVVFFLMMFQRPSNSILIGIYFYLAVLANELMAPQNEVTFTTNFVHKPKLAIQDGEGKEPSPETQGKSKFRGI